MSRHQFSVRTLLWLTLVVAAFLGGMKLQSRLDRPSVVPQPPPPSSSGVADHPFATAAREPAKPD